MVQSRPAFLAHFDELEDPRIDRRKLYPLAEILRIVFVPVFVAHKADEIL